MKVYYENLRQELMTRQYTWLITGVAGFIGSNLLEVLLGLNQTVIGMDNFSTGFECNIRNTIKDLPDTLKKNFYFLKGDICSLDDCNAATKDVDYVLHQAALGSVPRSIKAPEMTNATNVSGFLNMLISSNNARVKRFVYASSSSVYGDSSDLPKRENKTGNPLSPYAVSKYTNELYAKAFSTCYQIETIGLRYFNVFGPRQNPEGPYAAVIPRWINALSKKEPIFVHGDGETTRDFCYVENAVQANLLAATCQNPAALNRVFNIAVGEQNSLKTLYSLIIEALELPVGEAKVVFEQFREGDIRHSLADTTQAQNLLNYVPSYKLKDGLKKMIAWYRAAPHLQ